MSSDPELMEFTMHLDRLGGLVVRGIVRDDCGLAMGAADR